MQIRVCDKCHRELNIVLYRPTIEYKPLRYNARACEYETMDLCPDCARGCERVIRSFLLGFKDGVKYDNT